MMYTFSPKWVVDTCNIQKDAENAPPHCGSEARFVLRPWHLTFARHFDAIGLAADWPKHIAVAMVSAKCCFSYGWMCKNVFPHRRRQATKCQNPYGRWECFHKIWWKYTLKPLEMPHCTFPATGRGENLLVSYLVLMVFLYSSIWLNFVNFWHFFATSYDVTEALWC